MGLSAGIEASLATPQRVYVRGKKRTARRRTLHTMPVQHPNHHRANEECAMADEKSPAAAPAGEQTIQIPVDAAGLLAAYANFFRVTGTPEELVLDFGLNTQQMTATGPETVKLSHRLVLSFYTAKRLLGALQWAVNRYENNFGVLETDFQKRMRTPTRP